MHYVKIELVTLVKNEKSMGDKILLKEILEFKLEKLNKIYEELPSFVKKIFLKNKKVKMLASGNN